MEDKEKVILIEQTIEKIRPYIQRDGGDVTFDHFEDGIVYVEVHGACIGCSALDITIKDGIEAIILDEVPDVKEVSLVNTPYNSTTYSF